MSNWYIHSFGKMKGSQFGYTYVVDHHRDLDGEVVERKRPVPDGDPLDTIEKAETELATLDDLANEPRWFIERFTADAEGTFADGPFYFIHDGPRIDDSNLICPSSGLGYASLTALVADKRLSFLHNCGRCKT